MQEKTSYRVVVELLALLGDPLPQADGHEVDDRAPTWLEVALNPCCASMGFPGIDEGSLKGVLDPADEYPDSWWLIPSSRSPPVLNETGSGLELRRLGST